MSADSAVRPRTRLRESSPGRSVGSTVIASLTAAPVVGLVSDMGGPLVRSGAVGICDGSGSGIGRSEGEEDSGEAGTAQRLRVLGGLTDAGGQRRGDPTDGAVRGDLGQMGAVGAADGHGVLSDS